MQRRGGRHPLRTGSPSFEDVERWLHPASCRARRLSLAAERAGLQVAAVGWPGLADEDAVLQGPVIGSRRRLLPARLRRARATTRLPPPPTRRKPGHVMFTEAVDWANAPDSFSLVGCGVYDRVD